MWRTLVRVEKIENDLVTIFIPMYMDSFLGDKKTIPINIVEGGRYHAEVGLDEEGKLIINKWEQR